MSYCLIRFLNASNHVLFLKAIVGRVPAWNASVYFLDLGLLACSRSNSESLNRPLLCGFHYKNSRMISFWMHTLLAYVCSIYFQKSFMLYPSVSLTKNSFTTRFAEIVKTHLTRIFNLFPFVMSLASRRLYTWTSICLRSLYYSIIVIMDVVRYCFDTNVVSEVNGLILVHRCSVRC